LILFAHIILARSSSFSIHENALQKINLVPHIGMPMILTICHMWTLLIKVNEPFRGLVIQVQINPIWFQLFFLAWSIAFFSFCVCHVCGVLKIIAFMAWWFCCLGPQHEQRDNQIYLLPFEAYVCCPNVKKTIILSHKYRCIHWFCTPTLISHAPNLHLPWHDVVLLLHDHFHVKPLQPLQK
jgi:hypothetical protein